MNDNLPNDPNLVQDPAPVPSSFSPSPESPSIPVQESAPVVENIETISSEVGGETLTPTEVAAPTPAAATEPPEDLISETAEVSEAPPKNIVDKREHHTGDHKLETAHKVTAVADQEEEDFISHVEEVHTIA